MADISQNVINTAKQLLNEVSVFLKDGLPNVMQRALTIKKKSTDIDPDLGILNDTFSKKNRISIIIEQYKFTLTEKIVIFDRRYVNFNVYKSPPEDIKIQEQKINQLNVENLKKQFKNNNFTITNLNTVLSNIIKVLKNFNTGRTIKIKKDVIISLMGEHTNTNIIFETIISPYLIPDEYTQPIHQLTAYASSSQVGAWRLCKTEQGNRLNKFDDYVQSTVIHWKLARFICHWFYKPQLLWADETVPQDDDPQQQHLIGPTRNRNNIRNNRAPFVYPGVPPGVPPVVPPNGFPPQGTDAAIPVYYVMEDRLYAYQSFPQSYNVRTAPDNTITCKIVDRGLGSTECYNDEHDNICPENVNCPLPSPCPFDYWQNNGKCGDNLGETTIKLVLNRFSQILIGFYHIEQENGSMKITELYTDCMVYKNFKQEAHVFKVRLIPNPGNNLCYPNSDPPDNAPIPADQLFYKQEIDLVFVHYTIQQWADPNYEPDECEDITNIPRVRKINPKFNVQGYYILTIIPTWVLNVNPARITPCNFNHITDIGLFMNYIKAGYYVCKPLDYKSQCREYSFGAAIPLTVINLEYFFTGTRYNPLWPFKTLFGYSDLDTQVLSKYSEAIIYRPTIETGGLKRQLTLPPENQNPQLRIIKNNFITEDINCNAETVDDCPCEREEEQNKRSRTEGGRKKTNKNRKQYKNKLQTYKRKKCKQTNRHRKTMKRLKKRKTMKR